LAIQLK